MCKIFDINEQKDISSFFIFLKSSKYCIIQFTQGNLHYFCLASLLNREFFFSLSHNGNNLSVKVLKQLCQGNSLFK